MPDSDTLCPHGERWATCESCEAIATEIATVDTPSMADEEDEGSEAWQPN